VDGVGEAVAWFAGDLTDSRGQRVDQVADLACFGRALAGIERLDRGRECAAPLVSEDHQQRRVQLGNTELQAADH
jgi:hypothetical protein